MRSLITRVRSQNRKKRLSSVLHEAFGLWRSIQLSTTLVMNCGRGAPADLPLLLWCCFRNDPWSPDTLFSRRKLLSELPLRSRFCPSYARIVFWRCATYPVCVVIVSEPQQKCRKWHSWMTYPRKGWLSLHRECCRTQPGACPALLRSGQCNGCSHRRRLA